MNNIIKEKQLKEVLYGLDFIGNKNKNNDGILELGVNNCKLLLDYINNLQEENKELKSLYDTYELSIKNLTNKTKIIEDKKIDKLEKLHPVSNKKQQMNNYILRDKINEIIDKVNKL